MCVALGGRGEGRLLPLTRRLGRRFRFSLPPLGSLRASAGAVCPVEAAGALGSLDGWEERAGG